MKTITYQELCDLLPWGDTTAFVYNSTRNRFVYTSGEIYDDIFEKTDGDTQFRLYGISELPEVWEVIADNFLAELKPANGVEDEGYKAVSEKIKKGEALVAAWDEIVTYGPDRYTMTTYILILR